MANDVLAAARESFDAQYMQAAARNSYPCKEDDFSIFLSGYYAGTILAGNRSPYGLSPLHGLFGQWKADDNLTKKVAAIDARLEVVEKMLADHARRIDEAEQCLLDPDNNLERVPVDTTPDPIEGGALDQESFTTPDDQAERENSL